MGHHSGARCFYAIPMDLNEETIRRIGEAIARRREEEGISQKALSRMLGYTSHSHLSRIEGGKKLPSVPLLVNLADVLDVDVGYFFADIKESDK